MRKVLIAGCGDLGTRVGLRLAARGDEVWGLRRDPRGLPAQIRGVAADLADPGSLAELPAVDLVLYAAAADAFTDDAYRLAYVDGVRHLLSALEGREPDRWLHVSSTSVYAQSGGEWIDETSAAEPRAFSGRRILEGERWLQASAVEATVLRLAGIYGPGRTRLLDRARRGESTCWHPPVYTNRIHIEDAAAALVHLADLDRPAALYLGVDFEPALDGEVKRWLANRLGAPPPATGEPPGGGRAQGSNKRCRNRRLVDSGYRFKYADFRAGYGSLIDGPETPGR